MPYVVVLCALLAAWAGMHWSQRSQKSDNDSILDESNVSHIDEHSKQFVSFQRKYLFIYILVMGADWMQGPYMYKLYEAYGISMNHIGYLFIVGFMSSMVSGPFVGGYSDKFGRKFMCLVFTVLYSIACILVCFRSYSLLIIGRLLSGVATSILFSCFESWMLSQHKHLDFPEKLCRSTFAISTSANGIVAIFAGLVATALAENVGPWAPFLGSLCLLILAFISISVLWTENYGDQHAVLSTSIASSFRLIFQDPKILCVGLMQSFFEAGMYIFVFMWTPALENTASGHNVLLGVVFASFMVCISIGGSIFGIVSNLILPSFPNVTVGLTKLALIIFSISGSALLVPVFSSHHGVRLGCFFLFEFAVGMYFPTLGSLREKVVPEACRSTVMTIFRIPLNIMVAVVLTNISNFEEWQVFTACCSSIAIAFLAGLRILTVSNVNYVRVAELTSPPSV